MGEFLEDELKRGLREEEEVKEEVVRKRGRRFGFGGGRVYLVVGVGAVLIGLAFLGSGLLGRQEVITGSPDVELVNRLIEEQLSAQRKMNEKLLNEIRLLREELKKFRREGEVPSREAEETEEPADIFSLLKERRKERAEEEKERDTGLEKLKEIEKRLRELERTERWRRDVPEVKLEFHEREVKLEKPSPVGKREREEAKPRVFVPAGTVMRGRIVSGFFAPVGAEKKFPAVLIRLEGDAVAPNGFRVPLDGCRVIAKAEGDWVTERAKLQTYKLACVVPSGKVVEVRFNASVVSGVDGMDGVKGKFVNASAKQLRTFFGSTFLGSLFNALAQAQVRTDLASQGGVVLKSEVIKDEAEYAFYRALADTWRQFSEFYIEQAKKALPVVLVEGGIPVYLKVVDGFSLEVEPNEMVAVR